MATQLFKRGAYVRYEGTLTRRNGTYWTVGDRMTAGGRTTYILVNELLGERLRNVSPEHITAAKG